MFPAVVGNDVPYKIRPMVADSVKSKINISAGIAGQGNIDDEGVATLGFVSVNRGHTFQHINFSYGLLGFYGTKENAITETTDVNDDDTYRSLPHFNKSTSGLGLHASIGYHVTSSRGNTDYRVINWENSVTREFGDYLDYRKQLFGDLTYKRLLVSRNEILWTTGISSEIIFHHKRDKDFKHAFKLFFGTSPNLSNSFDHQVKTESANYGTPRGRSNFQFTYAFMFRQFNLTTQLDMSHFASSIALGYSF
jgi:hypothetical protein